MKLYSTNKQSPIVGLEEALVRGLAPDGGLYVPDDLPRFPDQFFSDLQSCTFPEISLRIAQELLRGELPDGALEKIITAAFNFPLPLIELSPNIFSLELYHGPTHAFKDFGARFMAGLLNYFSEQRRGKIIILVATSGDTGGAVASAFHGHSPIEVFILFPKGRVSALQEKQLTVPGDNIHAIEVDGVFDDCQRLVKQALLDQEISDRLTLASANSINIARLIPQSFYYFYAASRIRSERLYVAVPSGNFGNLTAGLMAKRMGLPVYRFVAATNVNDIVPCYLKNGIFSPRPSKDTISNAMDVGNPSNFARIRALYDDDIEAIRRDIEGMVINDEATKKEIITLFERKQYLLDPHGAVAHRALCEVLAQSNSGCGVFLETAHPGKFAPLLEKLVRSLVPVPQALADLEFGEGHKQTIENSFERLKEILLAYA